MPDLAPPMAGPDTVNFTSMVLARDSTSRRSRPTRIRVPPPAAPPRRELITTQPLASVSLSFHSNTISADLVSNFCSNAFMKICFLYVDFISKPRTAAPRPIFRRSSIFSFVWRRSDPLSHHVVLFFSAERDKIFLAFSQLKRDPHHQGFMSPECGAKVELNFA